MRKVRYYMRALSRLASFLAMVTHTQLITLQVLPCIHAASYISPRPRWARSLGEAGRILRELDKLHAKIAPVT
jgi:hypothetical protein